MEKAGGSAYYEGQPPQFQPATGVPVAPPYYPPQPTAPASFQIQDGYQHRSHWSTGLCGCGDDVGNCCITCWCPCVTFGQVAEIVDKGNPACGTSGAIYGLLCALTGCQWIYSCFNRSKLRRQYGLPESPCADCLVHCCCGCCALCQEYRELQSRGYDMEFGWQGNMERWARNQTVPPTTAAGMMR